MKINPIRISLFIFTYMTIVAILYWYFSVDRKNRINIYLSQQIEKLQSEFKATKNTYEKLSNFVYDELVQSPLFRRLVKEKKTHKLYRYLLPYYRILQKYHINYLSIILPNGKELIRMHKPNIRIPQSKRKKRFFEHRENGSESVIEFQKPIFDDRFLGIFQTAIGFNVLKKELQNLFGGYYEYILKRDYIDKDIFHYGSYLFVQSDLHPKYYYEENAIDKERFQKSIVHLINIQIRPLIQQKLDHNKNFALIANIDDQFFAITFLTIKYRNNHIGYLVSYKKDTTIALFDTIFVQNLLFGSLLVLILLSFVYYFLHIRDKFEKMAVTDKLTELYNRHKFYEIVQQEIARSKRNGKPFSNIIFDIDHFKKINDRYGHDVGDEVLRTIAKLVKENIRKSDALFRWGGEEFVILLPETDSEGAFKLAEKIRHIVEQYHFDQVGLVTISLGVSQFDLQNDTDIDQVIKRADNALYRSKEEGRNRTNIAL